MLCKMGGVDLTLSLFPVFLESTPTHENNSSNAYVGTFMLWMLV